MDILFSQLSPAAFAAACAVTLLAGFVKGATGFAMPLIMISGMGLFLEPALAVAALILPILMSNGLQVARFGWAMAVDSTRDFRRYVLIVCVMIVASAQLLPVLPPELMFLILGIPVVMLSIIQLLGLRFSVPANRRGLADWTIGGTAGVLGGLSGVWGPPTVLYLIALDTPKDRQIVVTGVVFGLGAVVLFLAHLRSGVLNGETLPVSAALLIPAFLGMQMGFWAGDKLNQALFRKVTLIVLVVAGLNLVRRGLMG